MTASISELTKAVQSESITAIVHSCADLPIVEAIAEMLVRHDLGVPDLDMKRDVDVETQRLYRRRAALALRCADPTFDTPGIYLAAEAMIAVSGAGPLLSALSHARRADKVRQAKAAIHAYLKCLAGEVPGLTRAMRQLADADAQHAGESL